MIHDIGVRWDSGEITQQKYVDIEKPKNIKNKRYIIEMLFQKRCLDVLRDMSQVWI